MSTTLKAEAREKVGTRHARKLRDEGRIPASLQAEGEKPHVDLSIDEDEFLASRRRHEHVYELDIGSGAEAALVRELHWDVFGERILHVEFRRVDLKKKTEVEVELEFTGNLKSGLLNHLVTHVTVSALPTNIPDSIEVRVEGLEPGAHITAADLTMPEGVDLAVDPELGIAQVSEQKVAEEPETPAEGEGEAAEGEAAAPAAEGDSADSGGDKAEE